MFKEHNIQRLNTFLRFVKGPRNLMIFNKKILSHFARKMLKQYFDKGQTLPFEKFCQKSEGSKNPLFNNILKVKENSVKSI